MPKIFKRTQAVFVGVDPGQSNGGLAALDYDGNVIKADPMPTTEYDILRWFEELAHVFLQKGTPVKAAIEKVHAMPEQGSQSGFDFGGNYHALRMAMLALRIPFMDPTPQAWMKALGVTVVAKAGKKKHQIKADRKEKLRAFAQQTFPTLPVWSQPKSLGKQRAVADALLIAHYRRLIEIGGLQS